jgi:hypothetical protein
MPRRNKDTVIEMLQMFGEGSSVRDICMKYGLSETGYYFEVGNYPVLQKAARRKRERLKRIDELKKPKPKKAIIPTKAKSFRSTEDKVRHLEDRLQREKAKNAELEELLKIAKESLGKS